MSAGHIQLRVQNLDCEHDAAALERQIRTAPGVLSLKVLYRAGKVVLEFDPRVTSEQAMRERLESAGFPPSASAEATGQPALWRNPKVLASVSSGLLLSAGWLVSLMAGPPLASQVLYLLSLVVGAYFFAREAIEELIFEREIGIELLMTVAAVVATLLGLASEGAMLAFLYSISEAAEGYTEDKTRAAVKALMDLTPKFALVRRDGVEKEIPVEELRVADVFIVKPGQAIPTDGVVLSGTSSVNQAPVTGESVPVDKAPDSAVYAGTLNGQGALEVRATKEFADNTIARIIQMVEEAQERKGNSQRFIERFGARYSPAVLLIGALVAVLPPLLFSADWTTWLTRATVFIVAAAPCALVISVPITLVATLGTGARRGVLIKGGVWVEELARVTVVALDKTGTLTQGEPEVTDVLVRPDAEDGWPQSAGELVALAAGVERYSEHPLARAIVRKSEGQGATPVAATDLRALTGAGATARVNGSTVYVGSPDLFRTQLDVDADCFRKDVADLQNEGKTVVLVGTDRECYGMIAIRDTIRSNARRAIEALREAGVQRVAMLTGDNEATARAIAGELGVDDVYAELKPEDKVARVRELARQYGHVAMVGDGVNDAPAMAEATVGIAMGAIGTDVALETADVALMADDLEKLPFAIQLARRNQRVVSQNLALSALVISALIVGAVLGILSLPVAVLAHELSEFVVIGSGLRMLRG